MKNIVVYLFLFVLFISNSIAQTDLANLSTVELDSLSKLYNDAYDYEKAFACAELVVERRRSLGQDNILYLEAVSFWGNLNYQLGKRVASAKLYREVIDALKSNKETRPIYVDAVLYLAYIEAENANYEEAEKLYTELLDLYEKENIEKTDIYIEFLSDMATFYAQKGDLKKAEFFYQKAHVTVIELFPAKKEHTYISFIGRLASFYDYHLQEYQKAEPLYLEVISLIDNKGVEYGMYLSKLAGMYQENFAYKKAESLYMQAVKIYRTILGENHPAYAGLIGNIAFLYSDMKKYPKAEIYYLKSLELDENLYGKEHPNYAFTLANLAYMYIDVEEYAKAEKYYLQAMVINKKTLGENNPDYAVDLKNLGFVYYRMKKYAKAEKLYKKVLQIEEEVIGKEPIAYAITLYHLANLYADTENYSQALIFYEKALSSYVEGYKNIDLNKIEQLKKYNAASDRELGKCLERLVICYQKMYVESKDIELLKQKYKVLEVALFFNDKQKNTFSDTQDKYRALEITSNLVNELLETSNTLKKEGETSEAYIAKAFVYAEANKSILLTQTIKEQKTTNLSNLPDTIKTLEEELQSELNEINTQIAESESEEEKIMALKEQNNWSLKKIAFENMLQDQYPKYYKTKYENITLGIADLQQKLDEKTMLIEYFVADTMTYVFAVTAKEVQFVPIDIHEKEINKAVNELRKGLSDYAFIFSNMNEAYRIYTENALWFYEKMLKEVLTKQKAIENLIIVADGELGHLPFEAFLVEAADRQVVDYGGLHYLLNDYNISYSYSATLWQQNKNKKKFDNNQAIFACAANYEVGIEAYQNIRDSTLVAMRHLLSPLSQTENEIDQISNLYQGIFVKNEEANEAFFKKNIHEYGVVHLAMHGILDKEKPILSSLVFTENLDTLEDNFLYAHEIYQLDLNADLVVLSACETGYGKFNQGEGVMSLARSFMYAGTPSLVVSLWQVNDQSTAIVMQLFYQYLQKGMPKDKALRQAKLAYIQNAERVAAHPAFWSPFIQLGDNKPIVLKSKNNTWYWIGGIGLGILVLVGIFGAKKRKEV